MIALFSLMPIRRKTVLLMSYYGEQYGCSPKYLGEYITRNHPDLDVVWAFTRPGQRHIQGARQVRYLSPAYFRELCTAGAIVTNYRFTKFFRKRPGQLYIQTWHSSLRLKMIERDAENTLPVGYVEMARRDSGQIDFLVSGCRFSSEIFDRAFWYDGPKLECGTPRNDIFFHDNPELSAKVRSGLGIADNCKIAFYAPTFRKGNSLDCYNIDFKRLTKALTAKFGGEWKILLRLHPHLKNFSSSLVSGDIIDATRYDDIQELLYVSDFLITDYSSLMFDFLFTRRPVVLYVPDLDEYTASDRGLYFNITDLPFLRSRTNDELIEAISQYDADDYLSRIKQFEVSIGSFETGNASRIITEKILNCSQK